MLTSRPFWVERIETLWRSRNIVWLAGARRLGKTVLSRQIPKAQVFNCDLPSVRERLADPELRAFRDAYPDGPNLLCCPLAAEPYPKRCAEFTVTVCAPQDAGALLDA